MRFWHEKSGEFSGEISPERNFKRIIEYIEAVEKSRTITCKTAGNVNYELQLKKDMKDIKINFLSSYLIYVMNSTGNGTYADD